MDAEYLRATFQIHAVVAVEEVTRWFLGVLLLGLILVGVLHMSQLCALKVLLAGRCYYLMNISRMTRGSIFERLDRPTMLRT